MQVLNPLTNSDIIGNVLYFKMEHILLHQLDAVPEYQETKNISIDIGGADSISQRISTSLDKRRRSFTRFSNTRRNSSLLPVENFNYLEPAKFKNNWTASGQVSRVDESEDLEEKASISRPLQLTVKNGTTHILQARMPNSEEVGSPQRKAIVFDYQVPNTPVYTRRLSKSAIDQGVVTRFGIPVSKTELESEEKISEYEEKRTLSYANTTSTEIVSIQDWEKSFQAPMESYGKEIPTILEEEELTGEQHGNSGSLDIPCYDSEANILANCKMIVIIVNRSVTESRPKKTIKEIPSTFINQKGLDSSTSLSKKIRKSTASNLGLRVYKAILCATDADYLQTSLTRALFRTNALNSSDAKLFQMPIVAIDETAIQPVEVVDHTDALFLEYFSNPVPESTVRVATFLRPFKFRIFLGAACFFVILIILSILLLVVKASKSS